MENKHFSVLLQEVIQELNIVEGGIYLDATLGLGGHSLSILEKGGKVVGIEADSKMLRLAEERLSKYCPTLLHGNFAKVEVLLREAGITELDGALFDLGISRLHYDVLGRGFTFKNLDEPLDMRLSLDTQGVTAADLINVLPLEKLIQLFGYVLPYKRARDVAHRLLKRREVHAFSLVADVTKCIPHSDLPMVFLALRIAVNNEYDAIVEGINGAIRLLKPKGRLVVISFHSQEDKIALRVIKTAKNNGLGRLLTKMPIVPTESEVHENPPSRSALMRVFEKI